jgi:hypothetical protein
VQELQNLLPALAVGRCSHATTRALVSPAYTPPPLFGDLSVGLTMRILSLVGAQSATASRATPRAQPVDAVLVRVLLGRAQHCWLGVAGRTALCAWVAWPLSASWPE